MTLLYGETPQLRSLIACRLGSIQTIGLRHLSYT